MNFFGFAPSLYERTALGERMNQSQESSGEHACPSVFPVDSNTSGISSCYCEVQELRQPREIFEFSHAQFFKGH
jgi:hypothetical protein